MTGIGAVSFLQEYMILAAAKNINRVNNILCIDFIEVIFLFQKMFAERFICNQRPVPSG
jgi:hypothetical protein